MLLLYVETWRRRRRRPRRVTTRVWHLSSICSSVATASISAGGRLICSCVRMKKMNIVSRREEGESLFIKAEVALLLQVCDWVNDGGFSFFLFNLSSREAEAESYQCALLFDYIIVILSLFLDCLQYVCVLYLYTHSTKLCNDMQSHCFQRLVARCCTFIITCYTCRTAYIYISIHRSLSQLQLLIDSCK